MAPTWHQRSQFEHKFQKVVRCYIFFFNWAILTQNSLCRVAYFISRGLFSISFHGVDPAFWLMRFPLNGELDFYFEKWFYSLENDLESPLIFVLFLKGKQNKKEKPYVWLLILEKVVCEKNRIRFEGQVTYRESTVKTITPL